MFRYIRCLHFMELPTLHTLELRIEQVPVPLATLKWLLWELMNLYSSLSYNVYMYVGQRKSVGISTIRVCLLKCFYFGDINRQRSRV